MRYLIIDALNVLYLRSYIVNPSLSTNGVPIGGIVGSFKSLQKLCNETKPDEVIIAWDGSGGSQKRKTLNKNYKQGRKPIKLNRFEGHMTELEEVENKIWQQTRLIECLNCLPVIQFMFDSVEADDVIASICHLPELRDAEKVIVSSDKDFLQLCDDKTVLYRPVQGEVLSVPAIQEKYGIHPNHFCLARSITGDQSDNLPGVPRAGLKTVAKLFPFLKKPDALTIQNIIDHCDAQEKKLKLHEQISQSKELISHNYMMMQLEIPKLSAQTQQQIRNIINNVEHEFPKTDLEMMMLQDGWAHYNFLSLYATMNRIMERNGKLRSSER